MKSPLNLKYHKILSCYFAAKPLYYDEKLKGASDIRKLVEQPWQQTNGAMETELLQTLLHMDFMEQKARHVNYETIANEDQDIAYGGVYALMEDIIFALESIKLQSSSVTSLKDILQFLRNESHNISRVPTILRQQALNRPSDSLAATVAEAQNTDNKRPWFKLINNNIYDVTDVLTILLSKIDLKAFYVSSDASVIIGAGKDSCIYLWNGISGNLRSSFYTEITDILSINLTSDNRFLIIAGKNNVIMYDIIDYKPVYNFERPDKRIIVTSFCNSKNVSLIAIGYEDGIIVLWNIEKREIICEFKLPDGRPRKLAFDSESHLIFVSTHNRTTFRYDYLNSELSTLDGYKGAEFFYVPNTEKKNDIGAKAILEFGYPQVELFLQNKAKILSYYFPAKPADSQELLLIQETHMLVEASNEGQGIIDRKIQILTLWDTQSGKKIKSINCGFGQITAIAALSKGRIAIGTMDGIIEIRHLNENKSFRFLASPNPICNLSFLPEGQLAILSKDRIQIRNLLDESSTKWTKYEQQEVAITKDGKRLMNDGAGGISSGAGQFLIPFVPGEQYNLNLADSRGWPVTSISISADESVSFVQRQFLGWNRSHYSAEVYSLSNGKSIPFSLWPKGIDYLTQRIYLNNSNFISSTPDGSLCIYNMNDGSLINKFHTSLKNINKAVIDPCGLRVAIQDKGAKIVIWDTMLNHKCVMAKQPSIFKANVAECISVDGARILTMSKYISASDVNVNKLILYMADSDKKREFYTHDSRPTAICISPDGALAASIDKKNIIYVWDTLTAEKIAIINNAPTSSMCFTSDGKYLAAGGKDGWIKLWKLTPLTLTCCFPTLASVSMIKIKGYFVVAGDIQGQTYILNLCNFLPEPEVTLNTGKDHLNCKLCGGRTANLKDDIIYCKNCDREFRLIKDRLEKPKFSFKKRFGKKHLNIDQIIKTKEIWLGNLFERSYPDVMDKTVLLWAFQDLRELYKQKSRLSSALLCINPLIKGLNSELELKARKTNISVKAYQLAYRQIINLLGANHIYALITVSLIESIVNKKSNADIKMQNFT